MSRLNDLITTIEKRSTDKKFKIWTITLLTTSGVLFICLSFFLLLQKKSPFFILLFLSEGIGQLFLARENSLTLKENDYQHRYFNQTSWGIAAAIIFSITIASRFLLAPFFPISLGIGLLLIYFLGIVFISKRLDAFCGLMITLSSAILIFSPDHTLALNQLLYSLLLVIATLWLRPWVAELINICLWLWLFSYILF